MDISKKDWARINQLTEITALTKFATPTLSKEGLVQITDASLEKAAQAALAENSTLEQYEVAKKAKAKMLDRLQNWVYDGIKVDLTNETLYRNAMAKMGAINARVANGLEYRVTTLTTGLSKPYTFKTAKDFIKFYTAAEEENQKAVEEMYANQVV